MLHRCIIIFIGLPLSLVIPAALADIAYDGTGTVTVLNYPAASPATLADLRAANDAGAWGVVQYDVVTDSTTLGCHLIIGAANGADTYLQIGRTNALTESLVMRGNLRVKTPSSSKRNGLILGTDQTNTVHPMLKFDCSTNLQYSLTAEASTIFHCYSAIISSTTTSRWAGSINNNNIGELYFTNSVFTQAQMYPFNPLHGIVVNCTFADGPFALGNGYGIFYHCTFSNLDLALRDYGGLICTVIGCTFTNNTKNWELRYSTKGIRAIDCIIGTPLNTNIVCRPYWNPSQGWWQYPVFFAQRHVVVSVKNTSANPVSNATVTVSNEQQDAGAVLHGLALTGADGRTPAINSGQALFLTDYTYEATDDPAHPIEKRFTYTITAWAPGYATNQISGVDPDESWTTQEVVLAISP